ncbi:YkoP family protein [Brevibacillus choshinensis]|uniref:YkoP family protein n=1 Tax=Brevibacillus choshinensis TaxID=54911 RepID=UPI00399C5286
MDDLTRLHALESERKISWRKSLLIRLWMIWEKLFHTCFRICSVDENNCFLQVRVRIYNGKTIRLSDGEEIRRGDRVAELHFDNELLLKMSRSSRSSVQLAIQMIRATEQVLPKITHFILCHPNHQVIKGVYGVSIIHRGTKQTEEGTRPYTNVMCGRDE